MAILVWPLPDPRVGKFPAPYLASQHALIGLGAVSRDTMWLWRTTLGACCPVVPI
jgi:hypothetical protein